MISDIPVIKQLVRWLSILLLALTCADTALCAQDEKPTTLTVVSDDQYPPYIFRDAAGTLRGIIPDQWALWEKKTHVKVVLKGMDWVDAQQMIELGQADVIDTIFYTKDRAKKFDFTPAYAELAVPIYSHEDLGGITDILSLKGMTVGVKAGDAVIGHLRDRGVTDLKEYPSYEAVILAAKNNEIKVFSVDKPAALYFMYKLGISRFFRESFILYTGHFRRAVKKNQINLLNLLNQGFDKISPREYRAIERKWMGTPFLIREIIHEWGFILVMIALAVVMLVFGNILLTYRVKVKTAALQKSEDALRKQHEFIMLFMRHSPIYAFIKEVTPKESRVIVVSDNFVDMIGIQASDMIGKTMAELFPPDLAATMSADDWNVVLKGEVIKLDEHFNGRRYQTIKFPIFQGEQTLLAGYTIDITERIQTEEARRESEGKYKLLTETMKDVVWIIDPETLGYLYISPTVQRLRGFTVEETLSGTVVDTLLPGELPILQEMIRCNYEKFISSGLEAGEFFTVELRQRCKDGRFIVVESIGHMWRNPKTGKVEIHGSSRDITERKKVEEELRESRREYAALLSRLPGMAYRCKNWPAPTVVFVSSGCEELTGLTSAEIMGTDRLFAEVVASPHWQKFHANRLLALDEHRRYDGEYEIKRADGACRWVWDKGEGIYDEDGNIVGIEGFVSDASERRMAAQEHERLIGAIEQSGEAIVITDAQSNILYVNPAFTRVSGYSREETTGQNPRILSSGMNDAKLYADLWRTLHAGRTWNGQFVNKRKDGSLYTEMATLSPVVDENQKVVNYVAVKRDVTQEIAAAKEKEALQSQLAQAQKLESVGCLAGGVAHDFNNMLQTILGYTEMALEQVPPEQSLHDDLLEIKKTALRSSSLTRQLLTFARKQSIEPAELNLRETVEGLLNMLRRTVGDNIRLEWDPPAETGYVMMDKGQFEQVVFNLCINARDAIGKTGIISVSLDNVDVTPHNEKQYAGIPLGRYVKLAVRDDGQGIEPGIRDKIFEPFFTTKPLGQGTGLGLSVVYGIVTQTKGEIRLESELGKGSEFQVFLPRHRNPVAPPVPSPSAPENEAQHATILLVDDEAMILRPTQQILERLGHRVISANSPKEAIKIFEALADEINLLITDVTMPDMSGPEMVTQLIRLRPNLKFFFMSGHTAKLLQKHGFDERSMNFIEKPFTRAALSEKIQEILTSE